ncbi:MAG: ion transporter [Acidobacteria bacterium]|nr:ion transporter [Acidobacteriota bacterium]
MQDNTPPSADWRAQLHEIIFEAETPGGKAFDVALLILIVLSVLNVSLESVASIRAEWGSQLYAIDWAVTILFTIEYVMRLACVGKPLRYARSFFGLVDLLSILPMYLSLFLVDSQSLLVIRAFRLLRIFRVLKLGHFVGEERALNAALRASSRKITVFVGVMLTITLIAGALMYLIEGPANGFTSIPESVYWAIVTMTTVGYGDIAPQTFLGKFLASAMMIMGYGIIAVPTGIVTVEVSSALRNSTRTDACRECSAEGHAADAVHCKYCGAKLD